MGADGHVKIYDKEKFEQVLRDFFCEEMEKPLAEGLLSHILETAEKYYTFGDYVIRYVEHGTNTWESTDWLYRTIKWYLEGQEHLQSYDKATFYASLEIVLMDVEVRDIVVWT